MKLEGDWVEWQEEHEGLTIQFKCTLAGLGYLHAFAPDADVALGTGVRSARGGISSTGGLIGPEEKAAQKRAMIEDLIADYHERQERNKRDPISLIPLGWRPEA